MGLSKATADALMEEFFGARRKEREVEVRQDRLCRKLLRWLEKELAGVDSLLQFFANICF